MATGRSTGGQNINSSNPALTYCEGFFSKEVDNIKKEESDKV